MSGQNYEGIAIIGMSGRFPGAESVEEFWRNLLGGVETISCFSEQELAQSGLDLDSLRKRGQYVPARGVLKDADCFDAAFFGIHPKEAEVTDPQQRVFLETCWAALENAGYAPNRMDGLVGVFAGATFNTYHAHAIQPRPDLIELVGPELVMFGNEKDYLTTRVAYKLGLKGPALNVSTACSSSLVAVGQACQSLLTFQCDVALAGGVSVTVPQQRGYFYDEGNISSADGHTRSFDAKAAGTVFGNGVGVVVLKRLDEAVRDGDQICAVIKAAALNNDGSQRVSFGAPGVEGQSEVIAMAHAMAGVDVESIAYVEAHGTATPLGDPIEVAALTKAFRLSTSARQFCGLGSVKTNVGHLDAAAGVTGLIKTSLALRDKVIPASLHFEQPNPKLDLENSPFYVNASLRPWKTNPDAPRRAGVSSFGTGGTNAHVVLEEAPALQHSGPSRPSQLLALSAKTPEALDRATANLAQHLKAAAARHDGDTGARELADAAFTLQTGRSEFNHRRIVACSSLSDAAAAVAELDPKRVFTFRQAQKDPPVAFMFPGQGAQYPGMGAELYRSETVFKAEVDRCTEILRPILAGDFQSIVFSSNGSDSAASDLLKQTRYTQPALFVIEYALAKLWMSWGLKPSAMIGHSVGEYVAGCLSGVLSLEEALPLIAHRAALVQAQPPGAMLAVRLPESQVLPFLPSQLAIAAVNSPSSCVVSGEDDEIAAFEKDLAARGAIARRLQTSHAFHSPMMDPVVGPFTERLRQTRFGAPQIPFVSNVTAEWITETEARSPEYWAGHLRQTVRFADGITQLMKMPGQILLEVGPGQTLTTLSRQHPAKSNEQVILPSLPYPGELETRGLMEAVGRVWMSGVMVDWRSYYRDERRRRVALPTYPFERKRYWAEPPLQPAAIAAAADPVPVGTAAPALPQEKAVAAAPAIVVAQAIPRKERLVEAARALLQDLSGYDLTGVDPSTSLFELGFDSLLLTQAAQLLQRKFGVSISFRQLMEELASIEEIAVYLGAKMPPEIAAVPAPSVPASAPQLAIDSTAGSNSGLEQLLRQQQMLTGQMLEMLSRQPSVAASLSPVPTIAPPVAPSTPAAKQDFRSHGPFKPIDKSAASSLSPAQSNFLAAFSERYIRRTAKSKKLAAENRPILADPRSVAGFKQIWKQMVYPIYVDRSDGSRVWDVDGNEYIDFVMGFGASLFGHRPPFVVEAVHRQIDSGFETGPIQPLAGKVAALVCEFTGMQRVGFTNTGSEAVLAATRVARTVTGRDKIVVFAGAYHGIFDEVLFRQATRGGEAITAPIAPGIPETAVGQVIVLDYGDPDSLEIIRSRGAEIAAVLVEPVQSRRLDLQPGEFLRQLRSVTEEIGSALVFDEVVTGFRVHPGGAQAHFGVRADLATYGKVIGGGLPIGVVAGSPKFMDALDGGQWQYGDTSFPEVGVTFFAGTFVRHPLALAAAYAVLTHLKQSGPELQEKLAARAAVTADLLRAEIAEFDAPYHVVQFSSLIYISVPPEQKYAGLLFYLLRDRGIHTWENRLFIITTAHSDGDHTALVKAFRESLSELRDAGFFPPQPGSKAITPLRTAAPVPVAGAGERFPLTEAQKEVWLASQMGGDAAVAYNESLSLRFGGKFAVDLFRQAVQHVIRRHPILLAAISADGLWQEIKPSTPVDLPLDDLSPMDEAQRERGLAAIVEHEVAAQFDLVNGPLVRIRIVRLSDESHVVVWTAHHIVCDGWSGGLIIGELAKIYSALSQGTEPILVVPASFRDYALATRPDTAEAIEALEYWKRQFASNPPPLELPVDRPRTHVRSAQASTLMWDVSSAIHQDLKRIAAQSRTTLVVILLAAVKTLLHRLSGETDIVVGLAAAGQAVAGTNCLVGHCVSLLPIRTQLEPGASFRENLAAVRKGVLDAFDHNRCTIGTLLQHLKVPRGTGRPPLAEIIFNLDRDPGAEEFHGLEFSCERNPKRALHFDFFFNFVESARGLRIECDHNTALYDTSTVNRWLENLQTLLESIAAAPERAIHELPAITAAERLDLVAGLNQTDREVPQATIHELVKQRTEETPNARAVTFDGQHLTYAELDHRSNQVARYLKSMGVGADVLVGLYVHRSLDMVVALLGILKAGGAYIPLDPAFPEERIAYMIADSAMRILVTHRGLDQDLTTLPAQVVRLDTDWDRIQSEAREPLALEASDAGSLAYVLYTSGSTGKPKGVEIPHSAVVNFLCSMRREPGFGASDTLLAVTTLSFDIAGLELFLPLTTGGHVVIASTEDAHDPERLMELMSESRCTVMQATPATWRSLCDAGWNGHSPLRVLCGGEALPADLLERLLPRCTELWNMYGPTETTIWSTVHRVTSTEPPVSIGRPIDNTQLYILDAHRNLALAGCVGEIYIGGAGLARGYLGRPELTSEKFVPNPFEPGTLIYRAGDLGRWLRGGILECLGRVDNQVKIRGYRIELGEIESTLGRHPGIRHCAVVAGDEPSGGKRLIAYYEPSLGFAPTVAEMRAHLKQELPDYMVPSAFVALERLPLTPNNKVDRKALCPPEGAAAQLNSQYEAPRDTLETALAGVWANVLNLQRIGLDDDFFDLGGHSLIAVRLLAEIRRVTGRALPLATLFQATTVRAFAELLRKEGWKPSWSSLVPIQPTGSKPPLFLIHGAEGNVLLYRQLARHLPPDQPVYGLQSRGLDGETALLQTVEEMAAHYVEEIQVVQPNGPYLLGGYCLGGTIAVEVAQQLSACGKEVGAVLLLDTYNGGILSTPETLLRKPIHALQNTYFHMANTLVVSSGDRRGFLAEKLNVAKTRLAVRWHALQHAFLQVRPGGSHNPYPHLAVARINDKAADRYQARPFKGRLILFRSRGYFSGFSDPNFGWKNIATDGLEVHELPMYQRGMLIEPFCRALAAAMGRALGKAPVASKSLQVGVLTPASLILLQGALAVGSILEMV